MYIHSNKINFHWFIKFSIRGDSILRYTENQISLMFMHLLSLQFREEEIIGSDYLLNGNAKSLPDIVSLRWVISLLELPGNYLRHHRQSWIHYGIEIHESIECKILTSVSMNYDREKKHKLF